MNNDTVSTEQSAPLAPETARELTDKIRFGLEGVFELIKAAYSGFAWRALGYASWDEYVQREFGNLYLRPPREEREEIISSMRDAGMSIRAIASATQLSRGTVNNELAASSGVQNWTPDEADGSNETPSRSAGSPRILGMDGRQHPANKSVPPAKTDDSPDELFDTRNGHADQVQSAEVDVDAVLDAPAEDVGVTPLDLSEIRSERDVRTSKLLKAFQNTDVGSLPRTMQLAEQISGLVSPLSGDIPVDHEDYESLTADVSSAVRQFSFVIKRLSQAKAAFVSANASERIVEDLHAALSFLRDSVQQMEAK